MTRRAASGPRLGSRTPPRVRGPRRGFTGLIKPHEAVPAVARLDRRVNAWTNRLDLGRRADAALAAVSTLANHSVLWAGIGVGLAATGTRGRNAAFRGYGSLLVSSAFANLLGKTLFGGDRPAQEAVPLWRRLVDPPSSPSFPSGHSASAAAFTAGVALEWPRVGLVLAPLAASVAYSRLHTGAHWFSDVVAGVALGTGVALAGRVLVPHPVTPVRDVPAGPSATVPALLEGDGLVVVVNTRAGSGRPFKADPLEAIRSGLPRARVEVLGDRDVGDLLDEAARGGARALGISGGDGTVAAAAAVARRHGLPLAVFPGGTLNHFAKAADVTSMAACVGAVRAGTGVSVDVADLEIGDEPARTVLNTFSVGAYPELVTQRERLEPRLGKWPAAVIAAGRVLRRARRVRLDLDGQAGDYWTLFAGVNRYYPASLAPVERERLDDGVLDVRWARAERRASRLRTFLEIAVGDRAGHLARRLPGLRDHLVISARATPELTVRFPAGAPVVADGAPRPQEAVLLAHDGETLEIRPPTDGLQVRVRMCPAALCLYAPLDPTAG
ncbi:MAG: bifunctional phosphatase PAP2/diacylglycerol kinase family protein [Cellulomonadaceae bacterium]